MEKEMFEPREKGKSSVLILMIVVGTFLLNGTSGFSMGQSIQKEDYYIDRLREREFPPSDIKIIRKIETTDAFTAYAIRYKSEGLGISGTMTVPNTGSRFPAVILNHGLITKSKYRSGASTKAVAYYLSSRGYLTVASDYRGLGDSDSAPDVFNHLGSLVDVLCLLESVKKMKEVDPERIGMWGHSQGGWITLKVAAANKGVKAAVLFAAMSMSDVDNYEMLKKWHPDVIREVTSLYGDPLSSPDAFDKLSAAGYLKDVSTAFSIHHGDSDDAVPIQWSLKLKEMLLAEKKDVELFTYAGEEHTFAGSALDLAVRRTGEFFDLYLKN